MIVVGLACNHLERDLDLGRNGGVWGVPKGMDGWDEIILPFGWVREGGRKLTLFMEHTKERQSLAR